jgi:hypothetical protein
MGYIDSLLFKMADQTDQQQLPLGMSYSTAYSLGIEATPEFSTSKEPDTRDHREGSRDSDQEESDGRRRGGFERDLRSDRESRRYAPYSTNSRSKGRISSSALKDHRIYVSNIPYNIRWQDLKDYMKKGEWNTCRSLPIVHGHVNFFLMTFCVENRYFTSAPKHNGTK